MRRQITLSPISCITAYKIMFFTSFPNSAFISRISSANFTSHSSSVGRKRSMRCVFRQLSAYISLPAVGGKLFDIARARLTFLAFIWLKYHRFRLICTVDRFFCCTLSIATGGIRAHAGLPRAGNARENHEFDLLFSVIFY